MFNIFSHQENANQNDTEIPPVRMAVIKKKYIEKYIICMYICIYMRERIRERDRQADR
jgi:hypothetical protein